MRSAAPAATSQPLATPSVGSLLAATQSLDAAGEGLSNIKGATMWTKTVVSPARSRCRQMRQQLAEMQPDKVRRSREHWRSRAEEKQRLGREG